MSTRCRYAVRPQKMRAVSRLSLNREGMAVQLVGPMLDLLKLMTGWALDQPHRSSAWTGREARWHHAAVAAPIGCRVMDLMIDDEPSRPNPGLRYKRLPLTDSHKVTAPPQA
jgi:hypothetical protein